MTPLRVGDAENDYFELHQGDIDGSDSTFVDSPWTDQQLELRKLDGRGTDRLRVSRFREDHCVVAGESRLETASECCTRPGHENLSISLGST